MNPTVKDYHSAILATAPYESQDGAHGEMPITRAARLAKREGITPPSTRKIVPVKSSGSVRGKRKSAPPRPVESSDSESSQSSIAALSPLSNDKLPLSSDRSSPPSSDSEGQKTHPRKAEVVTSQLSPKKSALKHQASAAGEDQDVKPRPVVKVASQGLPRASDNAKLTPHERHCLNKALVFRLLSLGITRILGTYYAACMRSSGLTVPSRPTIRAMRRIDFLLPGSMEAMWSADFPQEPIAYTAWTAIVDEQDGRFAIISRVLINSAKPEFLVLRTWERFQQLSTSLTDADPNCSLNLPLLPSSPTFDYESTDSELDASPHCAALAPTRANLQRYLRTLVISLSTPPHDADTTILDSARRELESFLLGQPRKVNRQELAGYFEVARKEDAENERKRKEWVSIGKRTRELRRTWLGFTKGLTEGHEVDKSIALVKKTSRIKDLPLLYRDVAEWMRIWIAYAFHFVFVTSPAGAELLDLLKSFHSLIPYGALKLGLALVNPTLAIKAVVSIVLGQPLGQPSLFQRIMSLVVGAGVRAAKKTVGVLREKLDHDELADALAAHVSAPFSQRAATRESSRNDAEDIILTIIRDQSSTSNYKLVRGWHRDFIRRSLAGAAQLEDDSGAGRYQTLKSLLREYCLKRDKEQVLAIVMEHNTPVLIRSSIAVFYDTIYKIANASNLSERLGDIQNALDDLIQVASSSANEASDFIKLAARHEEQVMFFGHELVSNGGGFLDPWFDHAKSGLAFIGKGVPAEPAGRNPRRADVNLDDLLNSVTRETKSAILEECHDLALVTAYKKAYFDICLRADLLAVNGSGLKVDRETLFSDLLQQDPRIAEYFERRGAGLSNRPEDNVSWAWFADEDVLDNPSAIKLDWKAAAAAEATEAQKRTKAMAKKASKQNGSKTGGEGKERMKDLPIPRVRATKTLLDAYLDATRPSLDGAKRAQIR